MFMVMIINKNIMINNAGINKVLRENMESQHVFPAALSPRQSKAVPTCIPLENETRDDGIFLESTLFLPVSQKHQEKAVSIRALW